MENKKIIHVVKYKWLWALISFFLLTPGIVVMIIAAINNPNHIPFNVGIDYTGGTVFQYTSGTTVDNTAISKLRSALEKTGIDKPSIQIINMNSVEESNAKAQDIIAVKTKFVEGADDKGIENKVTSVIKEQYKGAELISTTSVGPTLGKELFKNSLVAVILACLGIVAYLSFRFQFDFALAAIIALIHDITFVVGVFAILSMFFNVQIDGLFITAILTIIGFSVNDTVVIFDRIRENIRYYSKKMTFGEIVDASITQTIARSINTSLTTLLTLFALFLFGGVTTRDFVLAMILGITVGTYSSIFIASMLVDWWRERKTKKPRHA